MGSCSGNGSRGHHSFTLNLWESYVSDGASNYSTVNWELILAPIVRGYNWSYSSNVPVTWGVNIAGSNYSGNIMSYDGSSTVAVASGSLNVGHNGDGSKSIDFSFSITEQISASYLTGNASGSGSMALSNIPRYANITSFSVAKRDETSFLVSFNADAGLDWAQYRLNDGNWVDLPSSNIISGLSANTSYKIAIRVRRTDSQLWTESWNVWQSTYDYPKVTSLNNFTIGEGATVYLENPLGRNITLDLISNNDGSVIGTYTGNYQGYVNAEFKTADAINRQYASIPNANSGTYYARVKYGNITKTQGTGTYYTNHNDCDPTFSGFTYMDSNEDVTDITGNNQIFVKGLSVIKVTIPSANKMITRRNATPQNYALSCDTLNTTVNYSDNDINVELGVINSSGTKRLNVRAYDSRNNSALSYQDITVYDYAKPVINVEATRLNNFENETTLKVKGSYTKLTIDGTDKNVVTNTQYRYKETDGQWSSWTNINFTINDGEFTCSDVILSLDNSKSFEFEIKVTDRLTDNTETANVDIGQAIFFISSNQKACYINGQEILMYDVVDEWTE